MLLPAQRHTSRQFSRARDRVKLVKVSRAGERAAALGWAPSASGEPAGCIIKGASYAPEGIQLFIWRMSRQEREGGGQSGLD